MPAEFILRFARGNNRTYELTGTCLRQWEQNSNATDTIEMRADSSERPNAFPDSSSARVPTVRLMALGFIRLAQWQLTETFRNQESVAILEGAATRSPAARFLQFCKDASRTNAGNSSKWILEMFPRAGAKRGDGLLLRWFSSEEAGCVLRINAVLHHAPTVSVHVQGEPAAPEELDRIETFLSLTQNASVPHHHLLGDETVIAGRLPSIQPDWFLHDSEALEATQIYVGKATPILAVIGDSGTGKTVVAVQWLRHLIGRRQLRHRLVFSWSFPRQGAEHFIPESLDIFFHELARALNVNLQPAASEMNHAAALLAGIAERPVFMILDGFEATILESFENISPALAVLVRGIASSPRNFLLITSREEFASQLGLSEALCHRLMREPLMGPLTHPDAAQAVGEGERSEWILESELRRVLKKIFHCSSESELDALVKLKGKEAALPEHYFPDGGFNGNLRTAILLKICLHHLRGSLPEILLHILAVCDRPISEETLLAVAAHESLRQLYRLGGTLTREEWEDALTALVSTSLLEQASNQTHYSLHAKKRSLIANSLKQQAPLWAALHLAVAEELLKSTAELPSTRAEVVPLVQAAIHFCHAGRRDIAYHEIGVRRLARGLKGYAVYQLGDYHSARALNFALLGFGGITRPLQISSEAEALIIHVNALCLRFLDKLTEANQEEEKAWAKALLSKSPNAIMPIGFNYLRVHHIFGNLKEAKNVADTIVSKIFKAAVTGKLHSMRKLLSKEERVDGATGFSILALTQACSGMERAAKFFLRVGMSQCNANTVKSERRHFLMPTYGTVWHAFTLLELGHWETCEKALLAGELFSDMVRFQQTGSIELLSARTFLAKANASGVQQRSRPLSEGFEQVQRAMTKATAGGYRWWTAISRLTQGELFLADGQNENARAQFEVAAKISCQSKFQLLLVDTLIALARLDKRERKLKEAAVASSQAKRLATDCGYRLRETR